MIISRIHLENKLIHYSNLETFLQYNQYFVCNIPFVRAKIEVSTDINIAFINRHTWM